MGQQYNTNSYVVDPENHEPPECPPEDMYTLMLMGIKEIGLGKPFKEGDEPRVQFTLEFKIDAPDADSIQGEWHHFDLIGWYAPIMHYNPNLPDAGSRTYTEPNMYKLVRALNGGSPLPIPTEPDPDTGRTRYAAYDAAALLRQFFGGRFRSVIGPSASGWPRLKGDPTPMPQAGTGRRRGTTQPTAQPQPEPALVGAGVAADPFETGDDL